MNSKGFTIIETMVSILIIMFGVILIASILIHSIKVNKRTSDIFYIDQKADYVKNLLLSKSFNSTDLKEGESKKNDEDYKIIYKIIDRSDSLKEIILSVGKNNIKKKYVFFKSKYIN